jgi:DNA-directed RNA polymerase subunit RPC12/RpoP
MNDLINLLQTLALVLTLILVIFVLGWTVYAFRKFVVLFNKLVDELERPQVQVHTSTIATAPPEPPVTREIDADTPPEIKRYKCHRCDAKLPETPTHSIVKDEVTLLVFKCRRCGKETEVNPDQPK